MSSPDINHADSLDNTPVTVTADGQLYTPSLVDFQTDRGIHLDLLENDWHAHLILAIAADGNRITMHLSHNNRDTEEKFGNAIKLTLVSAMNKERQCFRDKAPQAGDSQKEGHRPLESLSAEDWKALLPN